MTQTVQTRQLGNSDLQITPIGVGAWAMGGGGWLYSWGEQDDQDSIDAIRRALDLGVNWIDTAAVYGLGHSEEVVGKAVKGLAKRPYIFTKCSRVWAEDGSIGSSLDPDSLRRECEDSLRRLDVDSIDLYQIHWPRPEEDIERAWETLVKLQQEGKVRHIGVSNYNPQQMERIMKIAPVTSLQPPYSAIRRGIEDEILPFCQQHNIGVIVYSPMQAGLLSGKMSAERLANLPSDDWRKGNEHFTEPRLSRNLALAELFTQIGARHGRSAGEVAIAWVLRLPAVTGAIVGFRSPEQVDGIVGAMSFRLSESEVDEVERWISVNP